MWGDLISTIHMSVDDVSCRMVCVIKQYGGLPFVRSFVSKGGPNYSVFFMFCKICSRKLLILLV